LGENDVIYDGGIRSIVVAELIITVLDVVYIPSARENVGNAHDVTRRFNARLRQGCGEVYSVIGCRKGNMESNPLALPDRDHTPSRQASMDNRTARKKILLLFAMVTALLIFVISHLP
jgi:hypothetical protein